MAALVLWSGLSQVKSHTQRFFGDRGLALLHRARAVGDSPKTLLARVALPRLRRWRLSRGEGKRASVNPMGIPYQRPWHPAKDIVCKRKNLLQARTIARQVVPAGSVVEVWNARSARSIRRQHPGIECGIELFATSGLCTYASAASGFLSKTAK